MFSMRGLHARYFEHCVYGVVVFPSRVNVEKSFEQISPSHAILLE